MSDYVPFSEPEYSVVPQDITPYNPQEFQQMQQSNCIRQTHCYICGKGCSRGYWKHCHCNTVPIGDGIIPITILLLAYSLYKYFKK